MILLAYLFLSWSLLNAFFVVASVFGSWMSQEKMGMNMKNHIHLLFLSLCLGSFFFFLSHSEYIIASTALFLAVVLLVPLIQDMIVLYTKSSWFWEEKIDKVKQIIPYYNPRLYVLGISILIGVVILLWQPLDNFLSWEILLGVVVMYYLGILMMLSRTRRYNFFRQGLEENDWSDFESLKPQNDVYIVIYFLIKGFNSWFLMKDAGSFRDVPEKFAFKLAAMRKLDEDYPSFVLEFPLLLDSLFVKLTSKERLYILKALERASSTFDLAWSRLNKDELVREDFIWTKIKKEKHLSNVVEVEKMLALLKDSDDKDALVDSLHLLKRQKLQSLELLWTSRDELVITEADYQRSSPHDRLFVKKYKMELFRLFDNCCIKSKLGEEIEIDHFFLPKSQGGSFLMQRKDGIWIVNAVILNKKYNINKGVKKIEDFFSIEELMLINSKLKQLALKINDELLGDL